MTADKISTVRDRDVAELPDHVLDRVVRLLLDAEVAGEAPEGAAP